MATRRSRLQIKPNIGPKGPVKGPAASTRKSASIPAENAAKKETVDVSSLEKTDEHSTETTKIKDRQTAKGDNSEPTTDRCDILGTKSTEDVKDVAEKSKQTEKTVDKSKEKTTSSSETLQASSELTEDSGENRSVSSNAPSQDSSDVTAESSGSKGKEKVGGMIQTPVPSTDTGKSAPFVRSRFRRFGKVSIPTRGSATSNKTVEDKTVDKDDSKTCSSNSNTDKTEILAIETSQIRSPGGSQKEVSSSFEEKGKNNELSTVKQTSENSDVSDSQLTSETPNVQTEAKTDQPITSPIKKAAEKVKPQVPVRARLPKAKPNLLEASKKRQLKLSTTAKSDSLESAQTSSPTKQNRPVPTITISTSDDNQLKSGAKSTASSTSHHLLSPLKSPPPLPRSPMKIGPIIPPSPIKSADKRARTTSVSEGVPEKKARKKPPQIDAPVDKPPDRSTMKMQDLIYWNPSNNPMKVKEKAKVKAATKEKENEEAVERVAPPDVEVDNALAEEKMPVPQVTIGPDGNIVINETSLMVDNTDDQTALKDDDIIDETDVYTTYGSFRKHKRSKTWTLKETAKFYRALSMVGVDFFLIGKVLPGRDRTDLKRKFKKEEKVNKPLIEKILREKHHFNMALFEEQSESEDEEAEKKKKKEEEKKRKQEEKQRKAAERAEKAAEKKKKNRKRVKNYFEDSDDSEIEEARNLQRKAKQENDDEWQPPKSADSDVAETLLDMSKGKLSRTTAAKGINYAEMEQRYDDQEEEEIIVEAAGSQLVQKSDGTFVDPQYPDITTLAEEGAPADNVPVDLTVSRDRNEVAHDMHQNVIPDGSGFNTINSVVTSAGQNVAGQSSTANVSTPPIIPQVVPSLPSGPEDKFIFVTVQPENGGETVIHVYRIHGDVLPDQLGVLANNSQANFQILSTNMAEMPQTVSEMSSSSQT